MKTLLVDAGNTAMKWRVVSADEPWSDADPRGTIPVDTPRFAGEVQAAWLACAETVSRAAGCCVATQDVADAIDRVAIATLGRPLTWLSAVARFESPGTTVCNGYRDPTRLGADRWHALIGARAARPHGTLLVVNAGTATTVDTLTNDGHFVGGVIAPGIRLMADSLARGTARLPRADGDYRPHPDDTDDAIHTGILDAQLGLIEHRIGRIRTGKTAAVLHGGAASDRTIHVLLSGGNAELMYKTQRMYETRQETQASDREDRVDAAATAVTAAAEIWSVEPDLVLRGLWIRATHECPS